MLLARGVVPPLEGVLPKEIKASPRNRNCRHHWWTGVIRGTPSNLGSVNLKNFSLANTEKWRVEILVAPCARATAGEILRGRQTTRRELEGNCSAVSDRHVDAVPDMPALRLCLRPKDLGQIKASNHSESFCLRNGFFSP